MVDVLVEALPEWLRLLLGALCCLAIPVGLVWMLWEMARMTGGIAKGLRGGPGEACQQLGLTVTKRGALSGVAEGLFDAHPVRVSWVVGSQNGFAVHAQVTHVAAAVQPPLGVGLMATEGGAKGGDRGEGIGWSELEQYMTVTATDSVGARAALGRAGAALWGVLGGPGRVVVDDSAVTVELPGVASTRAELEAALRRALAVATMLSTP